MIDKRCDKCKHRRMFYDNYPCKECKWNTNKIDFQDYFDEVKPHKEA